MVVLHLGTTSLVRLSAEDLAGLEERLIIGRRDGQDQCPPSCGLFCRRASCLGVHANSKLEKDLMFLVW